MSGNKKRQRILKLSMLGLEALLLAAVIIVSVSVVNNINYEQEPTEEDTLDNNKSKFIDDVWGNNVRLKN